jgi:hypothetical protein
MLGRRRSPRDILVVWKCHWKVGSGLKKLRELDVSWTEAKIGAQEVQWMIEL